MTGGGDEGGGQTTDPAAPAKGKQKRPGANTETLKRKVRKKEREVRRTTPDPSNPGRNLDGTPTLDNPTFSLSTPGAAPIGVPNFFIDKFRIPPFLLSIYQAAGIQYGIRWEVLAAINEIETDYGRNLNISSAGAVGWMQFMPATWKMYGVDANRDGKKDPFNPVDAIFAAARYLRAAGGDQDLRRAIFAYNHADWYVDSVLLRARVIGGIPSNLVGSLTGLTQGRFPVHAKATYADDISERDIKQLKGEGNKAVVVESGTTRRGIKIFSRKGAEVVAVNDGRVTAIGTSKRLGRYVKLQDVYGNTYTYAHLAKVSKRYPAPKERKVSKREIKKELELPAEDLPPTVEASGSKAPAARATKQKAAEKAAPRVTKKADRAAQPPAGKAGKERLFANPRRKNAADAGGAQQEFERTGRIDGVATFQGYLSRVYGLDRSDVRLKPLKKGSRVVAGTILGRIGKTQEGSAPHTLFEIRPAGRGAPRIDPKPILDGWKLLESTAIYRAAGKNPFFGSESGAPSIGQILLMSKESLIAARGQQPADPALRVRPPRRRVGPDRPPRARDARVPRRLRLQADGDLAALRPLADDGLRQRVRALHGQRGRHRRRQRHPDHGPPGPGLDHGADGPAPADAAGHDEAAPDHLADEVRQHGQHVRDGRPRGPHPRRLPLALRQQLQDRQAGQRDPQAQAVDQADRPAGRDRQPDRAPHAVALLAGRRAARARVRRPQGRVAVHRQRIP